MILHSSLLCAYLHFFFLPSTSTPILSKLWFILLFSFLDSIWQHQFQSHNNYLIPFNSVHSWIHTPIICQTTNTGYIYYLWCLSFLIFDLDLLQTQINFYSHFFNYNHYQIPLSPFPTTSFISNQLKKTCHISERQTVIWIAKQIFI